MKKLSEAKHLKYCKLLEELLKDEIEAPKKYRELAALAGAAYQNDVSLQHMALIIPKIIADQEASHERLLTAIKVLGCPTKE